MKTELGEAEQSRTRQDYEEINLSVGDTEFKGPYQNPPCTGSQDPARFAERRKNGG